MLKKKSPQEVNRRRRRAQDLYSIAFVVKNARPGSVFNIELIISLKKNNLPNFCLSQRKRAFKSVYGPTCVPSAGASEGGCMAAILLKFEVCARWVINREDIMDKVIFIFLLGCCQNGACFQDRKEFDTLSYYSCSESIFSGTLNKTKYGKL